MATLKRDDSNPVWFKSSVATVSGKYAGTAQFLLEIDDKEWGRTGNANQSEFSFVSVHFDNGEHKISVVAIDNNGKIAATRGTYKVGVNVGGLEVDSIDDSLLIKDSPPYSLRVRFSTRLLKYTDATALRGYFSFKAIDSQGAVSEDDGGNKVDKVRIDSGDTAVVDLTGSIPPGRYEFRITGGDGGLKDKADNLLHGNDPNDANQRDFVANLFKPVAGETLSVQPGITGATGPYVSFSEFTGPRMVPDGFNPNDKVETRVARLYYYRDAHRVAQLINRKVRSYNRAAVDVQRQLADKARTEADQRTLARQQAERTAIQKAQQTRQKERELQAAEQSESRAIQELTAYRRTNPEANPEQDETIKNLDRLAQTFANRAQDLRGQVQALRDEEVQANEQAQQQDAQEKLAREEQFRREVAAAHADPDTYAPGVPESNDPVEQVSVSVIGEGLIQLRGPLKGINQIRTMIDQIDTPVGQVRVSVHSVQINGEKADRMEVVAKHIQTYIDHARFLTMQSSEMLRKAVVQVASRKAEEARGLFPGETQEDRDQRYLYAFFGKDFIDELRAMDSEFLSSGNKILSLHSMDTTSLSSQGNRILSPSLQYV